MFHIFLFCLITDKIKKERPTLAYRKLAVSVFGNDAIPITSLLKLDADVL
jgi:hypothetical protein